MTQARRTLGIDDRDFWLEPWRSRAQLEAGVDHATEHLIFDAPAEVHLDEGRATLPVPVLRIAPMAPQYHVERFEEAVLVATSQRTRQTFAATVVPVATDVFRRVSTEPPREPDGWYSEALVVDARERLELPWGEPDTLWLDLVLRERNLGRTTTRLTARVEWVDPEAERYLEAERQKARPLPIWPPSGRVLPTYERHARSPALPEGLGITLAAERVVPADYPERCVLWGSYRLPVEPRDRVEALAFDTVSRQATAVVPIALLVTGSKDAIPTVWHLAVPSFEPIVDGVARGHFTLDLQQLANFCMVPQTYFFRAYAGEHSAGPAAVAVVRAQR
jgi:hypothetical protein